MKTISTVDLEDETFAEVLALTLGYDWYFTRESPLVGRYFLTQGYQTRICGVWVLGDDTKGTRMSYDDFRRLDVYHRLTLQLRFCSMWHKPSPGTHVTCDVDEQYQI